MVFSSDLGSVWVSFWEVVFSIFAEIFSRVVPVFQTLSDKIVLDFGTSDNFSGAFFLQQMYPVPVKRWRQARQNMEGPRLTCTWMGTTTKCGHSHICGRHRRSVHSARSESGKCRIFCTILDIKHATSNKKKIAAKEAENVCK